MYHEPPEIVYICAKDRSGSTLLGGLCGLLPGHYFVGELKNIWDEGLLRNYLCGCGRAFRECPFWQAVLAEAFARDRPCDAQRLAVLQRAIVRRRLLSLGRLTPGGRRRHRRDAAEYGDALVRLYQAIVKVSGCPAIVDTSKNAAYGGFVARLPGLRLRLIHLVRDSRAVAYSRSRRRLRPEATDGERHLNRSGAPTSALKWLLHNWEVYRLSRRIRIERVRYEDLVSDPRAALSLLAPGEAVEEALGRLAGAQELPPLLHTVAGNPQRFRADRLVLRADREWEERMAPFDRFVTTLLTWPLLLRFGYLRR